MIQETFRLLVTVWMCLILCGWCVAQNTDETKQSADKIEQLADDNPQPDDESKASIKQVVIGDAAPELKSDKGVWINTDAPIAISTDQQQLTLIVFETVW